MKKGFRTPLSKASGWGAAGAGTQSWWGQRLTSVALAPLSLWFVFSLAAQPDLSAHTVSAWVARPLNTVLFIALILITCRHMLLGLHVIIEDYVHVAPVKVAMLVALDGLSFVLMVSGVLAVLQIALS